jgi:hypothetical protein
LGKLCPWRSMASPSWRASKSYENFHSFITWPVTNVCHTPLDISWYLNVHYNKYLTLTVNRS